MGPFSWCPGGPRWRPQTELAKKGGAGDGEFLHSLLIKVLPNPEAQKGTTVGNLAFGRSKLCSMRLALKQICEGRAGISCDSASQVSDLYFLFELWFIKHSTEIVFHCVFLLQGRRCGCALCVHCLVMVGRESCQAHFFLLQLCIIVVHMKFGLQQCGDLPLSSSFSEPGAMNDLGNLTLSGGPLFIDLELLPKLARSSSVRPLKFKVLLSQSLEHRKA